MSSNNERFDAIVIGAGIAGLGVAALLAKDHGQRVLVLERAPFVGGRALSDPVRGTMPYTTYGDGMTQLAAFARTLYRPPQRPKRGRPPGTGRAEE